MPQGDGGVYGRSVETRLADASRRAVRVQAFGRHGDDILRNQEQGTVSLAAADVW